MKVDFATVEGLIAALKSPNVATLDAARRGLIASDRIGFTWPDTFGRPVCLTSQLTASRTNGPEPSGPLRTMVGDESFIQHRAQGRGSEHP